MNSKQEQRQAFLDSISKNEDDDDLRKVYADWLEEHDEPEEADRQRKWCDAKKWLTDLAHEFGGTGSEDEESYYGPYRDITYEDVVQAGHNAKNTDNYFVQMGRERARDMMLDKKGTLEKYWQCWQIVTGEQVDEQLKNHYVFSCSC